MGSPDAIFASGPSMPPPPEGATPAGQQAAASSSAAPPAATVMQGLAQEFLNEVRPASGPGLPSVRQA
eukprot:5926335-Alexandrium_andersonii.AAC.1